MLGMFVMGMPVVQLPIEPIDVVTLPAYSVAHVAKFVFDHFNDYEANVCVVVGDKKTIRTLIDAVIGHWPDCRALLETKFPPMESGSMERKLIVWKRTENDLQISRISILEADHSDDGNTGTDEIGGYLFRFDQATRTIHEYDT